VSVLSAFAGAAKRWAEAVRVADISKRGEGAFLMRCGFAAMALPTVKAAMSIVASKVFLILKSLVFNVKR
jgi:hypothetical protein